jgi:phosphoglycerate dehydrogenase-like enzyme
VSQGIDGHSRPRVVLSAAPRRVDQIFAAHTFAALADEFEVVVLDDIEDLDALLPDAFAIVGQPALGRGRLDRAPKLRALLNVEGNFFANVDYERCFDRGIHVLGCGPAYASAVAEYALGLALDLCRGITREDRAFRAGREGYVSDSTADSILLRRAAVGLIGFGNLGREVHRLLVPFRPTIRVHDRWLPDSELREHDVRPATLADTLTTSTVLFVLATVTDESEHLLDRDRLRTIPDGARVVLVSRAAVVDFDALLDEVEDGRFLAAIDVWPDEPVALDHRARRLDGLVLSAHRAGGIPSAFYDIGERVLDDLRLIKSGLPPVRMQVAARELVGRYRNRPVT